MARCYPGGEPASRRRLRMHSHQLASPSRVPSEKRWRGRPPDSGNGVRNTDDRLLVWLFHRDRSSARRTLEHSNAAPFSAKTAANADGGANSKFARGPVSDCCACLTASTSREGARLVANGKDL